MLNIVEAIYKLYPQVKSTIDNIAYDADGNEVKYDLESVTLLAKNIQAEQQRAAAYVAESDPLFFKAQRGEATMEEWQAKVDEIKARYPKV